jgi:ACR3 family arsenite efflux pump ArsB
MNEVLTNERKMTSLFERYLTLWVGLCILGGVVLGKIAPGVAHKLDSMPFLEIDENNFTVVKESVETMFASYLQVLIKRIDQQFTNDDVEAMFAMRKRWLEKQFFWDPFTSTDLAPYEVWSLQDLPPHVRF